MIRVTTTIALFLALCGSAGDIGAPPAAAATTAMGESPSGEIRGAIDFVRVIDNRQLADYSKPRSFWKKLLEWVAGPADRPVMLRPYALTQDSQGRLLIADPGLGMVHILDFERRRYDAIHKANREELLSPVGVATDREDNIYVTDSVRARIYVFDKKGKYKREFGDPRSGLTLQRPTGIGLDAATGRLYLTDTLRHQVLVLDLKGRLLRTIGQRGNGPGEFNYPTGVTVVFGMLYVVDAMNFRIQLLTPNGEYLGAFGSLGNRGGTLNRPKGIGVDGDGHIYVVDALFETVQVFDRQGRLLDYFGETGSANGEFVLPSGIYVDPRNRIFVADSYNQRIQEFRYRRLNP